MPGPVSRALHGPRSTVQRYLRRHRRPVAAVLAGIGALVALTALRTSPTPSTDAALTDALTGSTVRSGEVIVPVTLASGAIAAALDVGDIVDLVGLVGLDDPSGADHSAEVVARRARVVELPAAGSAFSGSSAGVVLIAVPESQALPLSAASANGGLTVVIRSR